MHQTKSTARKKRKLVVVTVTLLAIIGFSSFIYIKRERTQDYSQDFYKGLANGLTAGSFTRQTIQENQNQKQVITTDVNLDQAPMLQEHVKTTKDNDTKVINELYTVASLQNVYSRFHYISSRDQKKTVELSDAQKQVWGVREEVNYPTEIPASLYTLLPRGKLSNADAQKVTQALRENNTYTLNNSSARVENVAGQKELVIDVQVDPVRFAEAIATYDQITGYQKAANADPQSLKGSPPKKLRLTINLNSHTINKIQYLGANDIRETIMPYAGQQPIPTPTASTNLQELVSSNSKLVE